jgi:hypothetical protein
MSFFKQFPKTTYDLKRDGNLIEILDIFRNVDVNEKIIDPTSAYQYYYIEDGERPDQIANKLYGNSKFYWTFFVTNDFLKDGYNKWPLSYGQLQQQIKEDYTPYIVVELTPHSTRLLASYANPISALSFGASNHLIDGAEEPYLTIGTGYKFDVSRNQLWLKPQATDRGQAFKNFLALGRDIETGVLADRGDGTNVQVLPLRFNTLGDGYDVVNTLSVVRGWAAAWQAPYYYKGSSEDRKTTFDAISTGAVSNPYTYSEWLEDENQKKTAIRVIKREYITEFVEIFKEYVNS